MMEVFYLDPNLKSKVIKELHAHKRKLIWKSLAQITEDEEKVFASELQFLRKIRNKPFWINVTDITDEEAYLLRKVFNIHPLTVEDLFHPQVQVKVEEFPDYLFCVFYGIQKNRSIELLELDFIIGGKFLITSHKKEIASFNDLKRNQERLTMLLSKGNEYLFHKLLDGEVDNYLPVLEFLDDQIAMLESRVSVRPDKEILHQILRLKRLVMHIKRTAIPQQDKLTYLVKNETRFIPRKAVPYFRDVLDHSMRISATIDSYRENINSTFDAYMSMMSQSMNEVMKMLSIIATIALPLTVISSLYGTNFRILPGSNWPYGFWVMVSAMVLLCVSMLYYFRKKHWI